MIDREAIAREALRHVFRYDYGDGFIDFRPRSAWWWRDELRVDADVLKWVNKGRVLEEHSTGGYYNITVWTPERGWHFEIVG